MRLAAKFVCIFFGFRPPTQALEVDAEAVLAWWRARRGAAILAYAGFLSLVVLPPLILTYDSGSAFATICIVGFVVPHLALWLLLAMATSPFLGTVVAGSSRVDEMKAFSLQTLATQWAAAIVGLIAVAALMSLGPRSGGALAVAIDLWLAGLRRWWTWLAASDLVMLLWIWAVGSSLGQVTRALRQRADEQSRRALAAEAHAQSLARSRAEAELRLLQGQIEPHFLYNTLANLRYLIQTQSPDALKMVDALIEYLRSSLPALRAGEVPLGRELRHVEHYLELMRIRMPGRLHYRLDVPAHLESVPIPPLAVLTLVENAVKHGLAPRVEGGELTIAARELPDALLRVEVGDDGVGLAAAAADGSPDPAGTGLANLRERIGLAYGERASLVLADNLPRGTQAILTVPFGRPETAAPLSSAGTANEQTHA